MSFEQHEIEQMMRAAQLQREREAPRTRRQLNTRVMVAVAFSVAINWEREPGPARLESLEAQVKSFEGVLRPPETPKTRIIRLYEHDPLFAHTVDAAVSRIMQGFEDYERLRTD